MNNARSADSAQPSITGSATAKRRSKKPRATLTGSQTGLAASLMVDPPTLALARYAYSELARRGQMDPCIGFEQWMHDAIYERAHLVVMEFMSPGSTDRMEFSLGGVKIDSKDTANGIRAMMID